ncbi:hypothetical protein [Streptomyces sp. NRRL B-24484]|uniref:hypothetical protein n=1 Tax=Streptomyces sp. NRRL B-24484 TaxID=1463833 RepID=UPI0004BF31B6|nr:hypothetical protein [Streptomyces sp. NRRL B-24484]
MKNPLRDGGVLDRAMPYCQLVLSAGLLIGGLELRRRGGSGLWAVGAGVLMALACYAIHQQVRSRRRR